MSEHKLRVGETHICTDLGPKRACVLFSMQRKTCAL